MRRPPRDPKLSIFSARNIFLSLLQGVGALLSVLLVFVVALYRGQGEMDARALAFTTLIIANLGLILINRSWSRTMLGTLQAKNAALWWVVGGAVVFLGLVLYVPFLRGLFRFATLHFNDLILCLGAGGISILWFEGFKLLSRTKGGD